MSRTRIIYGREGKLAEWKDGELVWASDEYLGIGNTGPTVIDEIEPYVSPVTGQLIDSRAKRREDLLRTNSRPYEGRDQELKEAARQRAYEAQRHEKKLDESVWRAWYSMSPDKRRQLMQS